jgi:hypothetical protein
MNRYYRILIRWGISITLIIIGIIYINKALYCYWAAGGPPNPNPELSIKAGNISSCIGIGLIITAIIVIIIFRPKCNKDSEYNGA